MEFKAHWICASKQPQDVCPVFRKEVICESRPVQAKLYLTALGVYEARINGKRAGEYVLAPGWTSYDHRIQYQCYDVTGMLARENTIEVYLGKGWYSSPMPGWQDFEDKRRRTGRHTGILAELHLEFEDGSKQVIGTDSTWQQSESEIRFSEIYDGESYDAQVGRVWKPVCEFEGPTELLILQEGEEIREEERVAAERVFTTPAGETVVDFGQEITGYVEFTVDAAGGEEIEFLHGEVLDKHGNFYRDNYRSAKARVFYRCRPGRQTWHPVLTFFGFRYLKLLSFPGTPRADQFTAIAVHSDLKRTGQLACGVSELNQLFSNIVWGQRGNFLDVPTDCPQRDERLGWTGDAQVFTKTACYFYDVEKFFRKWLKDMACDQRTDGAVGVVIPDYMPDRPASAAWSDAAVICPWQIYLTYGNPEVLTDQFECMKKWVDYITCSTTSEGLWTGGTHFGDWLGLDAPSGSSKGSSREDFIASAFYAYSVSLLIKAGKVIGRKMTEYEKLYEKIVSCFRKTYPEYITQTEHVLAVRFHLAENEQKTADDLAEIVKSDGIRLQTGFVGTPYLLHVLSDYGHSDLAYSLLLRREYPSWLYAVGRGATTMWEHWDGIMENGDFWSPSMNSFNHYAYGAVADWVFEKAAGIRAEEDAPGFQRVTIAPVTDRRLGWLEASLNTRHGKIRSKWSYEGDGVRYEVENDMPALIRIDGREYHCGPGRYVFWGRG